MLFILGVGEPRWAAGGSGRDGKGVRYASESNAE